MAATVFEIAASGLPANDMAAFASGTFPSEPPILYYIEATASGGTTMRSPVFTPDVLTGSFSVPLGWALDTAGEWTFTVKRESDGSAQGTATIIVG